MVYVLFMVLSYTSRLIIGVVKTYLYSSTDGQTGLDGIQDFESVPQMLTVSKTGTRMQALDTFRG